MSSCIFHVNCIRIIIILENTYIFIAIYVFSLVEESSAQHLAESEGKFHTKPFWQGGKGWDSHKRVETH
jgi:hypothetical protein